MFENKTVVVTGGARGIGLGFTNFFAEEKANVFVCDVNEDCLNTVRKKFAKAGNVKALKVDISKEHEVEGFFELIEKESRGTDILVNNAGINITGLIDEIPVNDWDKVIAVNLRGAFLCTRYALRQMKKRKWGRIINMTSPAGKTGGAKVMGRYLQNTRDRREIHQPL
jgi:3-oxoacyl-[acyl-carrier protein] reductase